MSRFHRINTIWRKELLDTLRDRRTLIAMVLVPMVLYPGLMLGSLQALEVQVSYLVTEEYDVAVADADVRVWLRALIDSDMARLAAEKTTATSGPAAPKPAAHVGVNQKPPSYKLQLMARDEIFTAVLAGRVNAGLMLKGRPPELETDDSTPVLIVFDQSDIRSEIAATGIRGILDRASQRMLRDRLQRRELSSDFVQPLQLLHENIAPPQRMTGSLLGQIVPLILILMTLTGAIYPAIDLTAGERERGTLETLMAAPVPTIDLIAGKFVVVTLIGMTSAALNLLSIGGTMYFGGVGTLLTGGAELALPLETLPWVMLLLVPLAVLFSALLLAVCSFARSFKEAQNYIVPVMMAVMIPGVVGILPGTRLDGPILIMPVANLVVLTRELFLGKFPIESMIIVFLSTSLYAGAAVAVAAKLFGQEAVLFADSASIRTLFLRKFFKRRLYPTAAQALLVISVVYSLNFYLQQAVGQNPELNSGTPFLVSVTLIIVLLFGFGPWFAARYMKVDPTASFRLGRPSARALLAALCFGCSTWVLVLVWLQYQSTLLPMDPRVVDAMNTQLAWFDHIHPAQLVFFLAVVPALCEELFFRGYAISGLRTGMGKWAAIAVVALAFGISHYSAHRIIPTTALGLLFGLLVVQCGSIWPAMLAHFMHNAITILASRPDGLQPYLEQLGWPQDADAAVPGIWLAGAAVVLLIGVLLCVFAPRGEMPVAATHEEPLQAPS